MESDRFPASYRSSPPGRTPQEGTSNWAPPRCLALADLLQSLAGHLAKAQIKLRTLLAPALEVRSAQHQCLYAPFCLRRNGARDTRQQRKLAKDPPGPHGAHALAAATELDLTGPDEEEFVRDLALLKQGLVFGVRLRPSRLGGCRSAGRRLGSTRVRAYCRARVPTPPGWLGRRGQHSRVFLRACGQIGLALPQP